MADLFSKPMHTRPTHPAAAAFVRTLIEYPRMAQVFNPWAQVDPTYDCTPAAAQIRAAQLTAYLSERMHHTTQHSTQHSATTVLIAEAPGYQGARFSGIAMTSERILLGKHASVRPDQVLASAVQRTSRADTTRGGEHGMNEPTATVVWSHLLQAGFDGRSCVLWNTFAFHPHHAGQPMSNRTPTPSEVASAAPLLHQFLALFPTAKVIALGRVAQRTLASLHVPCESVRHPSMGGAAQFRAQMLELTRTPMP